MKHLIWLIALCLPQLAHAQRAPAPEPWVTSQRYEDSWNNRRDVPGGRCEEIIAAPDGVELLRRDAAYDSRGWLERWSLTRGGLVYGTSYTRDALGRIVTFVEVHGAPDNITEGRITRDRRTGRAEEISRRSEGDGLHGARMVRREVVALRDTRGGWEARRRVWLDTKGAGGETSKVESLGGETLEVEGARPTRARYLDIDQDWSFEHDKRGRLTAQREAIMGREYTASYDERGRLIAERQRGTYSRGWRYDERGQVAAVEIVETMSGVRVALEPSWGGQQQRIECVADMTSAPGVAASRRVWWTATRRGAACGMDYNDWDSLSRLCAEAAHKRGAAEAM